MKSPNASLIAKRRHKQPIIRYVRTLAALSVVSILAACSTGEVEVTTAFSTAKQIEKGDIVYFNDEAIGKVSDIVQTDDAVLVALTIYETGAKLVNGESAVVINRYKRGSPIEVYNRSSGVAEPLKPGQELRGFDSMFQLGAWMVGDAIQVGSVSITEYVDSVQNYLKSDEFERDKASAKAQLDNSMAAAHQAIKALEEDLSVAVDELSESEQEMAQAMQELGNELSPVVRELSKSSSELMQEIEKFTQGLANTEPGQQQTGQKFLESLIATLEQLNKSIEQGVDDADAGLEDEQAKDGDHSGADRSP